jgi:hypothetical protein
MRAAPEIPSPRGGAGDRSFSDDAGSFFHSRNDEDMGKACPGNAGFGELALRHYPAGIKSCIR